MDQNLLDEIKKAERDANKTIEKAEKKKAEIILEARKNAIKLEEKETERIKKEAEEDMKEFEEKSERERERIIEQRLEELRIKGESDKEASRKTEKAIEFVKKEFSAFLGE